MCPLKTAAFHTLGCKLNFSETSAIARQLTEAGFHRVAFEQVADVYVINTCSVTENADRECRKIVRDVLRINPEGMIVITGCYAQLKPDEIAGIPGVDLVIGAKEKFSIPVYLDNLSKKNKGEVHSCEINLVEDFRASYSSGERTRSFLKVQDGCDYPCTYCTIPLARGKSRSASIREILVQAEEIAAKGICEIVLTGVNIGDFGKNGEDLLQLIRALDKIDGISRYRISSIEPNLLTNEIIQFVAESRRFAPHFHIPLQSGSDEILALMKRRYRRALYSDRVRVIRELLPHAAIGVDVITGFPGETEKHFMETYEYLRDLDVSYLHVFTYSERDHTEAIDLPGKVEMGERKRRNKMLRILSEKKQSAFRRAHEGQLRPVLFENADREGMMYGYTDNYIRISVPYDGSRMHSIQDMEILPEYILEPEKLS